MTDNFEKTASLARDDKTKNKKNGVLDPYRRRLLQLLATGGALAALTGADVLSSRWLKDKKEETLDADQMEQIFHLFLEAASKKESPVAAAKILEHMREGVFVELLKKKLFDWNTFFILRRSSTSPVGNVISDEDPTPILASAQTMWMNPENISLSYHLFTDDSKGSQRIQPVRQSDGSYQDARTHQKIEVHPSREFLFSGTVDFAGSNITGDFFDELKEGQLIEFVDDTSKMSAMIRFPLPKVDSLPAPLETAFKKALGDKYDRQKVSLSVQYRFDNSYKKTGEQNRVETEDRSKVFLLKYDFGANMGKKTLLIFDFHDDPTLNQSIFDNLSAYTQFLTVDNPIPLSVQGQDNLGAETATSVIAFTNSLTETLGANGESAFRNEFKDFVDSLIVTPNW